MQKLFTCLLLITLADCFFFKYLLKAQDIHFSQFYVAPLTLNPAAAGTIKGYRFTSCYKDQWKSIGAPYKTIFASFDINMLRSKSRKNALGAGISFFSDKAGTSKMGLSMGNLSLAYHVQLNHFNSLGAGIQGGYGQRSISNTDLKWDNQFDGDVFDPNGNSNENMLFPNFDFADISGGLYWNLEREESFKANAGLAVFHLNNPSQSYYDRYGEKLFTKIFLHGGTEFLFENTNTALLPSFLLVKQGPFYEINTGAMIKFILGIDSKYTGLRSSSAFYLGGFYRFRDAISLVSRFDFKSNWSMGISYDINVSPLRVASSGRGGMEVSVGYKGLFDRNISYNKQ